MLHEELESSCSHPHTFVLTGGARHRAFLRYVVDPATHLRSYYFVEPPNLTAFEAVRGAAPGPAHLDAHATWLRLGTPVNPDDIAVVNRY